MSTPDPTPAGPSALDTLMTQLYQLGSLLAQNVIDDGELATLKAALFAQAGIADSVVEAKAPPPAVQSGP